MSAPALTRYHPPAPLYQDPDTPTWDFAHFPIDEEERRKYCINIKALKVQAMGNPLYERRMLAPHVQIDAVTPPPNARRLPAFAHNGGRFKLRIAKLIHPFRGGIQRSHIWLVDVLGIVDERSYGQAVMKIVQQSFYGDPFTIDGHLALDKIESGLELAATEDLAYTHCKELQGIRVPYCFGFYKFPMPHGEDAYVHLLEYIPGEHLFTWMNNQPHFGLLNINRPTVADSAKEAEELSIAGLDALYDLHHKCHVLHGTFHPKKFIIYRPEPSQAPQIIITDFAKAKLNVDDLTLPGSNAADRRMTEMQMFLRPTYYCCKWHRSATTKAALESRGDN